MEEKVNLDEAGHNTNSPHSAHSNEADSKESESGRPPLGQVFSDAEQALRKSFTTLGEWGDQARSIFENRPGVVLASVSIAGFMTGLLIRQGGLGGGRRKTDFAADPLIVFVTGALAGITLGPKMLKELTTQTTPNRSPFRDFGHH